jgi:hypothetical protein
MGLEPITPSLPRKCATNYATRALLSGSGELNPGLSVPNTRCGHQHFTPLRSTDSSQERGMHPSCRCRTGIHLSAMQDSNLRSPVPQTGALNQTRPIAVEDCDHCGSLSAHFTPSCKDALPEPGCGTPLREVWMAGFEPAASPVRGERADHAALHPDTSTPQGVCVHIEWPQHGLPRIYLGSGKMRHRLTVTQTVIRRLLLRK